MPEHVRYTRNRREFIRDGFCGFGTLAMASMLQKPWRLPTEDEKRLAVEFIESQPAREFALAMFNLNAFLYVN